MENKILDKLDNLVSSEQIDDKIIRLKNSERGLIEYTNSSKKIITEDNRQVLND